MGYIASFILGMLFMKQASEDTRRNLRECEESLIRIRANKAALNRLIIKTIRQMYLDGTLKDVLTGDQDDFEPNYNDILEEAKQSFLKDVELSK